VDQCVALPALQEFFGVRGHRRFALVVRRGKIDPRFAKNSAHSRGFGFFGDGILEVVHVGERGDAAANHLRGRKPCAPAHKILGHVFGFRRKNVAFQPDIQRHIIFEAAQQRHRHMRMPIDKSRQHQLPPRVDLPRRRVSRQNFRPGRHSDNRVACHRNSAVLHNAPLRVHRDDGPARHHKLHPFFLRLTKRSSARRKNTENRRANKRHSRIHENAPRFLHANTIKQQREPNEALA